MPSTYTANGGMELPSDGEQSATWGDTVNDNMSIIDRITNGVGAITLSGTTHALTTSNGVLSDGQYNVLVLGGSPSGTNTVTVSPNDGQRIYIVKNGSGQTATFTQGSGANVSVLASTTKIIYCDGAGSGAGVVDLTGSLDLGALIVAGTTVTATGAELNIMDGVTATTAELNIMDGVTATTAELNIMDGVTATTAEINKLDGFTGVVADLNYAKDLRATGVTTAQFDVLDGVTATTAELNILDGVTATTAELNKTDGLTATTTELNYTDGVTSAIQPQINAKAPLASPTFTGVPSVPTATVGTDTTQVATTAFVLANLPPASNSTAERSITLLATDTVAHGNGSTPALFDLYAICKTADSPYIVGEVTRVPTAAQVGGVEYGVTLSADATNFRLRVGSQIPMHSNAGGAKNMVVSSWRFIVKWQA